MKTKLFVGLTIGLFASHFVAAAPPKFGNNTCPVRINGVRLGADLTPAGSSLRNTIAYEPSTKRYHFWGFVSDTSSVLPDVVHATSTDGVHFTSDSNLSYGQGSADYATFGATQDPPLDFFRAAYDTDTNTWKLFNWTENVGASVGQYNYNTNVDDLGPSAGTTAVVHQGPLTGSYVGNHVGTFGWVAGDLFLRVDSLTGGAGQFVYTDGAPPVNGTELGEADLFAGTPYCWELTATPNPPGPPACADSTKKSGYVHNVGRTLLQSNGTYGTYYAFRVMTDASLNSARADKQVWYIESNDQGATWSSAVGVFADGNAVTIDNQPLASDGKFSSVEMVEAPDVYRLYFSTLDANEKFVMVSAKALGDDVVFAEEFDGCE